jgi:hypothetical protein
MKIYKYDDSGYFTGVENAQKNPMSHIKGESEYLMKLNSIDIEPPVGLNKIAKFVNGSWTLVDDPAYLKAQSDLQASEAAKKQQDDEEKLLLKNEYYVSIYIRDQNGNVISNPNINNENKANALSSLRSQRNLFLQQTDFALLADVPFSVSSKIDAIKTYRQALRDLPKNTPDPTNITWPVNPLV